MTTNIVPYQPDVQALIEGWIFEKQNSQSGSAKTETAYRTTIQDFRTTLQRGGLDLDSTDQVTIIQVAGIWAGQRAPTSKRQGEVSPATYNQRLAILSSFYRYCQEQARLHGVQIENPIRQVKKRSVQAYAGAWPLDADDLAARLGCMERTTPARQRDYALLLVAYTTGRRAQELVMLQLQQVRYQGRGQIVLSFEHCKGAKKMRDRLDPEVAEALDEYLTTIYGEHWASADPQLPVWVSFSRQNRGQAISYHTLRDICENYLNTGKTHALRHTFGVEMDKAGAPLGEISARLGHSNEKITSDYLKQLRSEENPYVGRLVARLKTT